MKRLLFFLIICISTTVHAVAYPPLEQVVTKLYANYSVREMETTEKLSYQKKRDGWHVSYMVYNDTTNRYAVRKEQLYWSSSLGKYMNLDMFPHGITGFASGRVATDIRNAQSYDFQRCPYFGYDGWDKDVIADFADYTGTNDTIYEGLARAYSNRAQGYTDHHYSFHLPEQQSLPEKERIDQFIENEKKAIAVYDAMRKRNPAFEVMVGAVGTKYCNEIMTTYDELLYYGREAEVRDYFKEELYDPLMRSVALNMLESCEPNGILFTNGDNDTYPLWYLQWFKGVRTDVAVMNISQMNTGHFLNRYRNGFMKVPAVRMQIPASVYEREENFYRARDVQSKQVGASAFPGDNVYTKKTGDDEWVYFTPCDIIVHNAKPLPATYDLLSAEDSAIISIDDYYMRQGDMAMIDVMLANSESRAVYAATSISLPKNLKDYFFLEGLVKRFIPAREKINECELAWLGPVASTSILKNNMSKMLASDSACTDRVNAERWNSSIRLSAMYAAEVLLKSDKAAALGMLNAMYAFCPYAAGKARPFDVYALDVYYKAGDLKSGDALGTALLDHIEAQLTSYQYRKLSTEEQSERAREKSALRMAQTAFDRYTRAALSARAQKINDRFLW